MERLKRGLEHVLRVNTVVISEICGRPIMVPDWEFLEIPRVTYDEWIASQWGRM